MFSLSRPQEKAHENGGIPLRALSWSLALHALVLGALLSLPALEFAGRAPAAPLQAMLQSVTRTPEAVAPAPTFAPPARKPIVQVAHQPSESAPSAVSQELTFASRGEEVPAAVPVGGIASPRTTSAPATVALPMPTTAPGPDAAGLRQYRLALAGEARRHRNYPDAARREGVTGTAEVRVSVNAGTQRQAELARSSGHAVLDSAALEMLRAAAAHAQVPESLRGQAFAVLLPVVFEVED
jgi:periplasmic protein TonB